MNPARLSEPMLNAFGASMAGLFLVLVLVCALPAHNSRGIWLELLRVVPPPPCCIDGNYVVVQMKPDKSVWVNEHPLDAAGAVRMVAARMENRAERAVYFVPNEEAAVQDIADLSGKLASSSEGLHVGLLSTQQINAVTDSFRGRPYVDLDRIVWPYCPGALVFDEVPILAGCK
jgi:biopolymer transport protein ExbD